LTGGRLQARTPVVELSSNQKELMQVCNDEFRLESSIP
jgi:hypothetical protein